MSKLKLPSMHSLNSSPPKYSSSSETTPLKEGKKSIFHKISSKSKAFLSRSSPSPSSGSSRDAPVKATTPSPSPILRGFSESLVKIPNIMLKTPPSIRSPKIPSLETLKKSRTCSTTDSASRPGFDFACVQGKSECSFEFISIGESESPSGAPLREVHDRTVNGRLPPSESISPIRIPFPKMNPPRPQKLATESQNRVEHVVEEREEPHPIDAVAIIPPDAMHTLECAADSQFLHIARFLQNAARHARGQESYSQNAIFHASAPLVLFAFILAIGVLLPRNYAALQLRFGSDLQTFIAVVVLGGALSALLLLRGTIWVLSVAGKSFCDMDLAIVSRKGECIAVDGTRMGEAELVLGSFLFG